jgi:hypothetical protein
MSCISFLENYHASFYRFVAHPPFVRLYYTTEYVSHYILPQDGLKNPFCCTISELEFKLVTWVHMKFLGRLSNVYFITEHTKHS